MSLTKRLQAEKTIKILILIPLVCCLGLGMTHQAVTSVAAVLLMHVAFQLLWPLQMKIQNDEVLSQQRATELSINSIIMDVLAVITNLIFGKMADFKLSSAFFLGAAFCTLAYFSCHCYLQKEKRI